MIIYKHNKWPHVDSSLKTLGLTNRDRGTWFATWKRFCQDQDNIVPGSQNKMKARTGHRCRVNMVNHLYKQISGPSSYVDQVRCVSRAYPFLCSFIKIQYKGFMIHGVGTDTPCANCFHLDEQGKLCLCTYPCMHFFDPTYSTENKHQPRKVHLPILHWPQTLPLSHILHMLQHHQQTHLHQPRTAHGHWRRE